MKQIKMVTVVILLTFLNTNIFQHKPIVAQTKPINLTGVWTSEIDDGLGFYVDSRGCTVVQNILRSQEIDSSQTKNGENDTGRITLTQQGNKLSAPPRRYFGEHNFIEVMDGSISGNQVITTRISSPSIGGIVKKIFRGIVSSNGNKITGTTTCEYSEGKSRAILDGTLIRIR